MTERDEWQSSAGFDGLSGSGGRLPVYLTSFVGRRGELAEIADLLDGRRLLTIAGDGGCGKTRLACEALTALADRWADGAWWVNLGSVTDARRVAEVAAAAVGVLVDPGGEAQLALTRRLRDRHLVLCLDNCEHLLDACALLVDALLPTCPGVTVVATSREPLGVAGETVWRVPSVLESEAVDLFADRARGVRPAYVTDSVDDAAVRTVCRRLDGIPLAVELAAAWVRMLSPSQIAIALDDRFRLLVGGQRGVIARHQTLAASVEWSYDLLREDARTLLRRLAVCSGGFTLETAEAVCAGAGLPPERVLVALGRLVDASMCTVDDRGAVWRYRLLETIREYAAGRLSDAGETATRRGRHLDHLLGVAETAAAALEHDDQDAVLTALEADNDNLRAALEWGLSAPDPTPGRRLAAALARLWFLHGHAHEGIRFLQRAVDLDPDDPSILQADLLCGLTLLAIPGGRLDLMEDASRRAIEIGEATGDGRILARALAGPIYHAFYVDFARAQELAQAAQRHGALAGEVFAVDLALLLEACSLTNRDRHDEAVALARTLFDRTIRRHDRFCASFARAVELWAALFTGDLHRARALGIEAVDIAKPLNDYTTLGTNATNLAWVHGLTGDVDEALRLIETIVRSSEDAGPDGNVVGMSVTAGKLHLWRGDLDTAVEWFQRAIRFGEPTSDNWVVARALPGLASALRRLGRLEEAAGHAQRARMLATHLEIPHLIAEAIEETAHLAATDDPTRAEDLHHEALRVRRDHGLRTFMVDSLDALGGLAAGGGRFAEAARLLAASAAARQSMGYPRRAIDQPAHDAVVAAAGAALGDDGFRDASGEGAALTLDEAVAYASRSRGPRLRPSAGWASLTPAEEHVVALVAGGLTNQQIASRLFNSPATVKTHLSHVYAKLGVANRAELAALASRQQATDT